MDFRGQVWERVWEMTNFLVLDRVRIWRTGRHTPTKNSQEYPRWFVLHCCIFPTKNQRNLKQYCPDTASVSPITLALSHDLTVRHIKTIDVLVLDNYKGAKWTWSKLPIRAGLIVLHVLRIHVCTKMREPGELLLIRTKVLVQSRPLWNFLFVSVVQRDSLKIVVKSTRYCSCSTNVEQVVICL